jgi:hypothetical protein
MMGRRHYYYTLIASLPWLPRFDQAERLPITRERLQERLKMLEPDDAEVVERAAAFLAWQRHPAERTDHDVIVKYHRMMEVITHPTLSILVEEVVDQRTIMVALRRRHRGLPAPAASDPWAVGRWTGSIERNWDVPDFKLSIFYPWLPQAKAYLESGEALALEKFLMDLAWDRIDRLAQESDFGFESVLAYLFKWDMLQRWLSYNAEAAQARFEELVLEVTDEYEQLFN